MHYAMQYAVQYINHAVIVQCNTRFLWEHNGWDGLLMDGKATGFDERVIHNHFINESNIVSLLQKYQVPRKFDLLSVDLDASDYWVAVSANLLSTPVTSSNSHLLVLSP